jgi:hypothetical protein
MPAKYPPLYDPLPMNDRSPITGNFPFYKYAAKHNIWEFIPMDQGGRLVHLQLIGSEKDERIVAKVRRKSFFSPWGNPIQWDALESTQERVDSRTDCRLPCETKKRFCRVLYRPLCRPASAESLN